MSIITENLLKSLIINPYYNGMRRLKVLSGYASPTFVHHVLYSLENIEIELIIGMIKNDPISIWEHKEYLKMYSKTNRLNVKYYMGEKPIHSKVIYWGEECANDGPIAFVGSANFTRNGYINYQETMAQTNPANALEAFPKNNLLNFRDPSVEESIKFAFQVRNTSIIDTSAVANVVRNSKPKVDLFLTRSNNPRKIQKSAGLNWGQRSGREKNQAYIPVPKQIHEANPGFFPESKVEFTLITDDGESFVCVMAQDNNKAIETCHDNSILGKYFRRRLGLPLGDFITIEDLDNYGRNFVTIYKIDGETYFMDFS